MAVKPSLPKGTRDLLPGAMLRRELIINTIKEVFKKYGFAPIETPAMENLDTLTGKYGEEGDRLIFKILNSGDFLSKADQTAFHESESNSFAYSISEKALRYDLTVPFARFVVQNQNELTFPFKRYQVQPVWRADRPQKGRFREFYQCDADAVGSNSLLLELEFIRIYDEVFKKLGLEVEIHLNNRKLLAGLATSLGVADRLGEFTVILDKMDKIGREGVEKELKNKNFPSGVAQGLFEVMEASGSNGEKLAALSTFFDNETGRKGQEEVEYLLRNLERLHLSNTVVLNLGLARGLDYYTGAIFEVTAKNVQMGSIGGGGRYDDLTGIFGMNGLSGVGISFGLDRIEMVMEELGLFKDTETQTTEVLFVNFGEEEALYSFALANELRDMGIKAEVYPDKAKVGKQLDFANKKGIPSVIMIGSKEMNEEKFALKDMKSGNQQEYSRIELLELFSKQESNHGRH